MDDRSVLKPENGPVFKPLCPTDPLPSITQRRDVPTPNDASQPQDLRADHRKVDARGASGMGKVTVHLH